MITILNLDRYKTTKIISGSWSFRSSSAHQRRRNHNRVHDIFSIVDHFLQPEHIITPILKILNRIFPPVSITTNLCGSWTFLNIIIIIEKHTLFKLYLTLSLPLILTISCIHARLFDLGCLCLIMADISAYF